MVTFCPSARRFPGWLAIFAALWIVPSYGTENSPEKERPAAAEKARKPDSPAANDRVAAAESTALEFAREHHPELAALLKRLKAGSPQGYEEAIRDLSRVNERLARMRGRAPERYELELELWKLDSRIRLLAARLAMNDDPELRDQLQTLIRKKLDVRKASLEDEQKRITARLDRIESDLTELQKDRDALVEAEQERLLKSARASASKNRRFRPPAGNEAASKVSQP